MKKIFITLLLFPSISRAQQNIDVVNFPPKNEVGIVLLNDAHFDIWKNGKAIHASSIFRNPVGLMYTRHFGKNAIRVSSDYYVHAVDINNDAEFHYNFRQNGTERNLGMSIGYERTFTLGKFNVDPFADVTYRHSLSTGRETVYGCFVYEDNVYYKRTDDIIGGRAGIDLKYQLTSRITLSVESSYGIDKTFHHDLLAGSDYSYFRNMHFDPLDHIGIAFRF